MRLRGEPLYILTAAAAAASVLYVGALFGEQSLWWDRGFWLQGQGGLALTGVGLTRCQGARESKATLIAIARICRTFLCGLSFRVVEYWRIIYVFLKAELQNGEKIRKNNMLVRNNDAVSQR